MNCQTNKDIVVVDGPELVFPDFPEPYGIEHNKEEKTVEMPEEYFAAITEFKIDVYKIRDIYNAWKEAE